MNSRRLERCRLSMPVAEFNEHGTPEVALKDVAEKVEWIGVPARSQAFTGFGFGALSVN